MVAETNHEPASPPDDASPSGSILLAIVAALAPWWRWLILAPIALGTAALGISYTIPPVFTARTMIVPPQSQQSLSAAALASVGGALGGLAAGAALRTPADQYAAFLQCDTLRDRLVDEFGLMDAYKAKLRIDARHRLGLNVRVAVGRKDGLITIDVDDTDPTRAAAIANAHVKQLVRLTSGLLLTEAQQRRAFFERQVETTRARLAAAQADLQATGFSEAALRSEPRAAADAFARLKAEATAAEVRLQTMRRSMTDTAPEVINQMTGLAALREQLARLAASTPESKSPDYLGKYREFKYQESLYELFLRQYEYSRLDESREGTSVQVVDVALVPERKSWPKRANFAIATTLAAEGALLLILLLRHAWLRIRAEPQNADFIETIRRQFPGRRS